MFFLGILDVFVIVFSLGVTFVYQTRKQLNTKAKCPLALNMIMWIYPVKNDVNLVLLVDHNYHQRYVYDNSEW